MKTSQGSTPDKQGQHYTQGRPAPLPPPGPAAPPSVRDRAGQPGPRPDESHIGNVTIFRTAQFFVHAVSERVRTSGLQNATGNTSLIERVRWVSTERQNVQMAETRLLPQVELINPIRREIVIPGWFEALVVLLGLGIAMAVHGINVFGFPFYQQDEGLLMANAWAILHGKLEPYPFTYNQTPFGWILIAAWSFISGGFSTFGNALNSGRELMLLFAFGNSLLVYLTTTRLSGSRSAGLLALILFALAPLGITYQREVLLDNIGVFWLLLALYLLFSSNSRMPFILVAGGLLGVAILTKEIFLIFFPVMLYAVWLHATIFQRKFSLVVFTYITLSITSLFALMALLKGELLPTGVFPWDHHAHPSLLGGIISQVQNALYTSDFPTTWQGWTQNEHLLFIASGVALVINLVGGWRNRLLWLAALLLLTPWLFMVTTGIAFPSYFIILLPLMALNIALALNVLLKTLSGRIGFDLARVLLIFALVGAFAPYSIQQARAQGLTELNSTSTQVSALNWIRSNAARNSTIIVDSDLYADLQEPGGSNAISFPRTQLYWNAIYDPDVRFTILHDDWRSIDYVVVDTSMLQQIREHPADMILLDRALHHATLVQQYQAPDGDPQAIIQIYQVIHAS